MKKHNLPYNILLAITLAVTGLMVFYNLYVRESFPVIVRYEFPGVHRADESSSPPDGSAFVEPEPDIEEDQTEDEPEFTPAVVYIEPEADDEFDEGTIYWDGNTVTEVHFPLDLNQAAEEELRFIPGIGDVTAQRIIQYRDLLGGYTELEQLMEIKGIGEKTFESISPYLYVGESYDDNDNEE